MKTVIKYVIFICTIVLGIIFIPNVFQKGGIPENQLNFIVLFYLIVAISYNVTKNDFKGIRDRIGIIIISLIISAVVSIFSTLFFIALRYGDHTWDLWESNERILTNSVQYVSFGISLFVVTKLFIDAQRMIKKD